MQTGRRTFLKTVAASGAVAKGARLNTAGTGSNGPYAQVYTGEQLRMLAFPLGGIGTGTISLGGRGQLRDWEIFNKPDKGKRPRYGFTSIWVQASGEKPRARVLEAKLMPPYEGASGLGTDNVPGLPRFASARFTGEYPMAHIDFEDATLPVAVSLEAFTPIIPLDADASGLPVAILRYRVRNPGAKAAAVSIAFSLDNPVGQEGRTCAYRESKLVKGLVFSNPFQAASAPLSGTFVVGALDIKDPKELSFVSAWREAGWTSAPQTFWDHFTADGTPGPEPDKRSTVGSLAIKREVAPGATADFTFLLAWRFPNRTPGRSGWHSSKGDENTVIGNHYCKRFESAWAAAEFAAEHLAEYEQRTRAFVEAMRRTTIPALVREGAMANLSTLVSQTSFRTADGRFHGFEGCNDATGCCYGSCTHVWNYETASAHLFPTLSRDLRNTSFGVSMDDNGRMDFREVLPTGTERQGVAAADGQMGQIMHLYLDWRLSGDTAWLRERWPAAKRALAFAWIEGGWDANRDGVMEGVQHNTYDVEFLGPNPLCGVWYLGALRAAEEMAHAAGDAQAAADYRQLFEKGSRWIDANLFNGDYYIQRIQGTPRDKVAKGLLVGMGASDTQSPDFQVGEGCLVDQLAGQYMAGICGLGNLLDAANMRKALESIYRYNYKRRMGDHESVQRIYALNDEAALVICDYGRTQRPSVPFPYFSEVMTGFEYTAATLMIQHGMVAQGVECISNIRRRYDGTRRNPWNEAECGHHYARAMASWSAILALSGWDYHAGDRALTVNPAGSPRRFASFWSCATGWGSFSQTSAPRRRFELKVTEGSINLSRLRVDAMREGKSVVRVNGQVVESARDHDVLVLSSAATLSAGTTLTILS